jgi:hypothetical protein
MIQSRPPQNRRPFRRLDDEWEAFDRAGHAPSLVFSPLAWLKLQLFLHAGDTEVGGFGISSEHDLLYVEDFETVKQAVTIVSVKFEDQAVADYTDACVDAGMGPQRFLRIWCHTHPGESPNPSMTDEETFGRVFGSCDWSVMFIIGRTGKTYARLAFSAGPAASVLLPVSVDWASWPQVALERIEELSGLFASWIAEYTANIHREQPIPCRTVDVEGWNGVHDPEDPYSLAPFIERVMGDPTIDTQAIQEFEQEKGVQL